jgi:hypothetical protein
VATFGASVAARMWPILKAAHGLTVVTLRTATGTVIDPVTGDVTETVTTVTVDGKVSPFRPDEVDGVRVTAADKKVLVQKADVPTPPLLNTDVTIDNGVWHLQAPPETVSNDGLWSLHIRRVGDA